MEKKRGRPLKKSDYDPETVMRELLKIAAEVYKKNNEIKATAIEFDLPPNRVKKLLMTGNVLHYPEAERIQSLQSNGKTIEDVQELTGLSRSAINTYLPYS